jgi:hypothetical protein
MLFGRKSDEPRSYGGQKSRGAATVDTDLRRTAWFLGSTALIGILALALWSFSRADLWASTFALGLFLMGGAALVGGVVGLLFGIPKSVSDPVVAPVTPKVDAAVGEGEAPDTRLRSSYTVNTNLEQISDWLTKIMVGVGLTQVGAIQTQFNALSSDFGKAFAVPQGALEANPAAAAALIITYGLTAGFLAGYLLTRMFLPGAFIRADAALLQINTELKTQIAKQEEVAETAGRMQGEIYNDLYRYDEQGFRDAIAKLDSLLKSPVHMKNPALWVYLAAAHGQAYRWENLNNKGPTDAKQRLLDQHRVAALGAVEKALELSESWKPILQMMWDPNHPNKRSGMGKDEDDLEVFADDPKFKELLGT